MAASMRCQLATSRFNLLSRFLLSSSQCQPSRAFSNTPSEPEAVDPDFDEEDYQRKLAKIRDCSGLTAKQKRRHEGKMPDPVFSDTYKGIKRNKLRRLYAKHGSDSGINPSIMFPSRAELADLWEVERDWMPSFQQMKSELEENKRAEAEAVRLRDEKIDKALSKMPQLIKQFEQKQKKEVEVEEKLQEKNEKLLEEFRETYGFSVTVNSAQFRTFKAMKREEEKELKKKQKKEEKRETSMRNLKELLGKDSTSQS